MHKTIAAKIPETDVERLEKIAASRGESISSFVRDLVRKEINGGEKEDPKPVQNPAQNSDPTTAKKIEEVTKLLSRFPPDLAAQIGQLRDEIGQIPKAGGSPALLDSLKQNTRELDDLKRKIDQIGGAGGFRISFKNPEFRKKILIGWASGFLLFLWLGGWGAWHFYQYGRAVGIAEGDAYANPFSKTFDHLMLCNEPGWKTVWMKGGTELWCFPYSTSPGKGPHGWMIQ